MGDPSAWAEFGLQGLVILALFATLGVGIKVVVSHIEKIGDRHREERLEWKQNDAEMREKTVESIKEITSAQTDTLKGVESELRTLSTNVIKRIHNEP